MADCGHALCLPYDVCRFVVRTQAERDADGTTWRAAVHDEPRCTLTTGTCYCTGRAGCLRTNEDAD